MWRLAPVVIWFSGALILNALDAWAGAHHPEAGRPLLHNIEPAQYQAGTQNWAIVQGPRGLLYVGNNDGVLEYDGVSWRLIPLPNLNVVRSLALGEDGRIWVGGLGDLGYLAPDGGGRLGFVSLADRLPKSVHPFEDVWKVHATPDAIWFQVRDGVFRLDREEAFETWDLPSEHRIASFWVDGTLWVQQREKGLLRWETGGWISVSDDPVVRETSVDVMLAMEEGILVGTRDRGLFLLDENHLRPFANEADESLRRSNLYQGRRLPTGEIALATLNGGLVLLDGSGKLLRVLDRSTGLRDQSVYSIASDSRGGLWLALSSGLARVEVRSPLSILDGRAGFDGLPYDMVRHQGLLWIAHGRGVGVLEPGDEPGSWARVRRVTDLDGQSRFAEVDGRLLVASHHGSQFGVWEIVGEQAILVRESAGHSTKLLRSTYDPSRIWVGIDGALASIRLVDGRWVDEGRVPRVDRGVQTLAEDSRGRLWFETESGGVARLDPAIPGGTLKLYAEAEGISPGYTGVAAIAGGIVVGTPRGLLRFDEKGRGFVPDDRFGQKFVDADRRVLNVVEDALGDVWIMSSKDGEVALDCRTPSGPGWEVRPTALDRIQHLLVADLEVRLVVEPDGVVWLSGSRGLLRYDPRVSWSREAPFTARIRRVEAQRLGEVFGGASSTGAEVLDLGSLAFDQASLRIEVAAPVFERDSSTRYQAMLEGLDEGWSPWTSETAYSYSRLREGSYRFRVRARDIRGAMSEEGDLRFEVEAPWFRTPTAYVTYALALLGLVVGAVRWNSRRLLRETRRLEALISQRTSELVEANRELERAARTDPLTGLLNRRAFVDRAEDELVRFRRTGSPFGLVLADVDGFKALNDTWGHDVGDEVLREIAKCLERGLRRVDVVARWGGEEFVFLLPDTTVEGARVVAEKLRASVATLRPEKRDKVHVVTVTLGVTASDRDRTLDDLIRRADQALYEGKAAGRDRVVQWGG